MEKKIKIFCTTIVVFLIALVLALIADNTLFKTYYAIVEYEQKISL